MLDRRSGRNGNASPVKSFRVYFQPPVLRPPREVSEYSVEEQSAFRAQFARAAERYRRHRRYVYASFGVVAVLLGIGYMLEAWLHLSISLTVWIGSGFWLGAAILLLGTPRLFCPACANNLKNGSGSYCPECGGRSLSSRWLFRLQICSRCQRWLRRGKHRGYRLRFCTHCGLKLDEGGLEV